MTDLNKLRSASEDVLSGLKADEELKARILSKAAARVNGESAAPAGKLRWMKLVPAACCVAAVLLVAVVIGTSFHKENEPTPAIVTYAAGVHKAASPVGLRQIASVFDTMELTASAPAGTGNFVSGSGGYFPLVSVDGRYYRQCALNASGLGAGQSYQVSVYTSEPALYEGDEGMSNVLPAGSSVFSVPGMNGAFVVSDAGSGSLLFQRVSFNGVALTGGEAFRDTLPDEARVIGISDQNGPVVTDPSRAKELFALLRDGAVYEGSNTLSGSRYLYIDLDNGLSYQFTADGTRLSACGTWSCPEFFTALGK